MRRLLTLLLSFLYVVCFGQGSATDYTLSLDFAPSFTKPSKVTICSKQDTNTIEFIIYDRNNKKDLYLKSQASISDIETIAAFSKNYKFSRNSWRDKLGTDTVLIDGNTMIINTVGTDGITVNGTFTQNNITKEFSFWSSRKESENHKLIEQIITLLYQSFPEERAIKYIEQLEGYFSFGLGLKIISDDPLKYRIYGSISSNEEKEITNFINSLPFDKDIFIDLSNFNGMGAMFYPLFKSLIEKNKRVYWVKPSPEGLKHLCEIEVPSENILK